MQNRHIVQIREEYAKIEDQWMEIHKKINLCSAVVSFAIELVMFFVLFRIDVVTATVPVYVLNYMFVPTALNFMVVGVMYFLFYRYRENRVLKRYVVSLCLIAICFILFSVHNIFSALYILFAIPIMLTTVYGDYQLTTTTALSGMAAEVAGELLVFWDPNKVSILMDSMEVINFLISLVILIAVYAGALVIIYYERQKNEASIKKELERYRLQLELLKDNLTSLYNRAALQEQLQVMEKSSDSFVFVMIDVDDFKQINDTMGHVSGDTVLKKMADVLTKYSKDHPAFRFGGDEFCILFKNETAEQAVEICRKIQAELKRITDLEGIGGVTASFGIACYEEGLPAESLVEHADKALYESKKNKGSITIYEKAMGGDIG